MIMNYRRILTIQDISCVGQCSLTVAHPILSACGHETCVLPTTILSTHTGGFGKPVVHHLGSDMDAMWRHWLEQGITFDAILVGYLGSMAAIQSTAHILDHLLAEDGVSIIDPAMGDHGKLYSGFDEAYATAMKELCAKADILIPNITEASMMSGVPYREELDHTYVSHIMNNLSCKNVVLTGVSFEKDKTGVAILDDTGITYHSHPKIPKNFHGTGDIFAASFVGILMQDHSISKAARLASEFTCRCIENTYCAPAHWYGVKFETVLPWLIDQLNH